MEDTRTYQPTEIAGGGLSVRSQAESLISYLTGAVAAYEERIRKLVAPLPAPPDQPYKALYAYAMQDSGIFFGRAAATRALYQAVLQDRLTVLHARSGAGKTSLLSAGLVPHLIREGRLPVYARTGDDPVGAIKRAIISPATEPGPDLLHKLTLHQFLGLVRDRLSKQTRELVIILDQFEEFFILWPERSQRQPFVDALTRCYDDKLLPVRFVIALRKDYFSDLAEFQSSLPTVLCNECWLGPMNQEQAYMAIVGPVAKSRRPLVFESALVDTLVRDLSRREFGLRTDARSATSAASEFREHLQRGGDGEPIAAQGSAEGPVLSSAEGPVLSSVGGIEPLRLQLVCARLYAALDEEEAAADEVTTVTLASYEKLGRDAGEMRSYVQDALRQLPEQQRTLARRVMKELVSAGGTRRLLSCKLLQARLEEEETRCNDVLDGLVDAWLLRREEIARETVYELAHECLIAEIDTWIEPEEQAFKRVQDLLRHDVAMWRMYGTLIPRDRLELFHAHRERLNGFESETWECLLRSSLTAGTATEDWVTLAGELGERLFLAYLNDQREEVRRTVTRSLGIIWGLPELSDLAGDDQEACRLAAEALGKIRDTRTVGPLIAVLQRDDSAVRRAGAWALGRIGDLRALGPLLAALVDDGGEVREAAATALGEFGDPRAIQPLMMALRDPEPSVRWAVMRSLGTIWYLPELIRLGNEDRYTRWAAVRELGKLGNPRAVAPLIAILEDDHRGVRRAAGAALAELGEAAVSPLIATLRHEDWDVRWTAVCALGELEHPRALEPLIMAMRDNHPDVRQAAAEALTRLGEPAVDPLITALGDADADVRRRAAEVLGELGHPQAVEALIGASADPISDVRQTATDALAKLGEAVVGPLTMALWDDNRQLRLAGVTALGNIGDASAVGPLIDAMQDDDSQVRREAAVALEKIGDRRAVEPFIVALGDGNRYVRREVAWALGELSDRRAVEPLIASLHDEDRGVRQAAASALVKLGAPTVEPLGVALMHAEPDVCWAIINVLGEIGDPRAVEPLITILQDGDAVVRRAVAASLGKIGDKRALWPLIALLDDQDSSVRWAATGGLGELGDPRATQSLVIAVDDEDQSVRRGASDALKKIGPPHTPDAPE